MTRALGVKQHRHASLTQLFDLKKKRQKKGGG